MLRSLENEIPPQMAKADQRSGEIILICIRIYYDIVRGGNDFVHVETLLDYEQVQPSRPISRSE
jgi:hypothetical protein